MTGQGRDDVIGLEPFQLLAGDIERLGRRAGQGDLRAQVFRHRLSVGLVEIIHVVAERVAALVEDHRHMGRRIRAAVVLEQGVDLAEVCITSAAPVTHDPAPADAFALEGVPGVAVAFARAPGAKCARCWKVLPEVTGDLCPRCARVLAGGPS